MAPSHGAIILLPSCTSKANNTLGILRRNLNPCTAAVKDRAYKALVRPHLEYASAAWRPYLVQDCYKLETIYSVRQLALLIQTIPAYCQRLSHDASTSVGHPIHQTSPQPTIDVPQDPPSPCVHPIPARGTTNNI